MINAPKKNIPMDPASDVSCPESAVRTASVAWKGNNFGVSAKHTYGDVLLFQWWTMMEKLKYLYLSIYLSIFLSIYPSICLSIYQSINLSNYLSKSIYLSSDQSINLSNNQFTNLSIYQSIFLSINLFIYQTIY